LDGLRTVAFGNYVTLSGKPVLQGVMVSFMAVAAPASKMQSTCQGSTRRQFWWRLCAVVSAAVQDGAPLTGQVNMLKALMTAREVAGAMEYLHSQNVLHGDLNGNNILLTGAQVTPGAVNKRGFTAKVADFGLSRLLSPGG
jgi:serine/threonine protein kinase